jgi:hypothetical protein
MHRQGLSDQEHCLYSNTGEKGLGDSKCVEFHQRQQGSREHRRGLLRIRLTTLEMADHPTDGDREDDAQDWKHETGSNSVPPKRITNRELWTPPIDHKR